MRNAELFRGVLELPDDDRHDPYDTETPEPCRGCNRTDCGEQCAEFRAWLAVAYLAWDAAGDADELSRCDWCMRPECGGNCADFKVGSGGDADAR
jgi:hypothetical protein